MEAGREGKRKGKESSRGFGCILGVASRQSCPQPGRQRRVLFSPAAASPRLENQPGVRTPHVAERQISSAYCSTPLRGRVAAKSRRSAVPLFWIERGQVPVDKTQGAAAPLVEGADFLKTRSPWRSLPHATRQVPTCVCRCYR